jgi:hypothetical protein
VIDKYIKVKERNIANNRMKGGLKVSEKIQKNAGSTMKNLLKIDFSYLDKEELMALSTQSSVKTKNY